MLRKKQPPQEQGGHVSIFFASPQHSPEIALLLSVPPSPRAPAAAAPQERGVGRGHMHDRLLRGGPTGKHQSYDHRRQARTMHRIASHRPPASDARRSLTLPLQGPTLKKPTAELTEVVIYHRGT
eukprot:CAMPEP_0115127402 /NCGR_PEP_ID=MMETSP0227-20121206/50362_1 /TAXON_ID=89957 /ORGANISM="Polarella glacialis, Strain CCMP 1383" /LENGTH=124 /DNA_ID=CAMNT_0002531449 /DNA_START=290 /DNA_END=660 /DNA_ORIENTATION=+